jgi:hypothetical protein
MSTKYTSNLFDNLKEAFKEQTSVDSSFKDFLKTESGKTYVVRLVPNTDNIANSWFSYSQHIWKSTVTGKTISTICPNTYKEKCPICEYRSKIWATKDQTLIDQIKPLKKSDKTLYNVYVISDPTNPDNQGKVKFLNAGTQLDKIIKSAGFGEDSDEFGPRIFDLSEKGCNLQIKVETNEGGYPTYTSSRFKSPSKIEGLDTDEKINAVYDSFKPVDTIFKKKSYEEIKNLLDVHFLGKEATPIEDENSDEDEFKIDDTTSTTVSDDEDSTSVSDDSSDEDQKIKDILKGL